MRKLWRNLLIGACILSFIVLLGFFNATKPRILVLHSAAEDSPWARQVDAGIQSALRSNRRPVSVDWMYMGVGAPAYSRGAADAVAEAHRAIARTDPDILIAVDDEANSLVAQHYVGRSRPRIVYVSLDRPAAEFGYTGASNVSGISEQLPWHALRDTLITLFPNRKPTLAVLGVTGATGQAELMQFNASDWSTTSLVGSELVSTAPQWRDFVTRSADSDVLLVLHPRDLPDTDGRIATAAELSRWTQEHARPLPIGMHTNFVESGGPLSLAPAPADYGSRAIQLALDWLDDRTTPGAPVSLESSHFDLSVRQSQLARRGFTLPPIYLEAARENGTLFD